jgi:hypothetical protein
MKYVFDIDGTICQTLNKDYENALPYSEVIDKINELYDSGNQITLYTARGGTSGIDYHSLTVSQLEKWKVKYHELIDKGKPNFDILIDDKAINAETWRNLNKINSGIVKLDINHMNYIQKYLDEVKQICDSIDKNELNKFIGLLNECKNINGRIFVIGVGGSAANASHAVNDFRKICGIETYSVSENIAELTARNNQIVEKLFVLFVRHKTSLYIEANLLSGCFSAAHDPGQAHRKIV